MKQNRTLIVELAVARIEWHNSQIEWSWMITVWQAYRYKRNNETRFVSVSVSFLTRARQQKLPYNQWPEKSPAIGPECNAGASGQGFSVLHGPFFLELRVVYPSLACVNCSLKKDASIWTGQRVTWASMFWKCWLFWKKRTVLSPTESWPWHAYIVCTCVVWWDQKLNRSS